MATAGSEQRADLSFLPPPLIMVLYFSFYLAIMDFIILVEIILSFYFMKIDRQMLFLVLLKHACFNITAIANYTLTSVSPIFNVVLWT